MPLLFPAGGVFGCGVLAWFLRWGADLAGEVTGQALIAGINLSADIGMARAAGLRCLRCAPR